MKKTHEFYHIFILKRNKIQTSFRFLSYANVFSGGLFLSMALIHLLPEASLTFNAKQGVENVKELILYNENYKNSSIFEISRFFNKNVIIMNKFRWRKICH